MAGARRQPSAYQIRMREQGYIPDSIWYQINGKSFDENFVEIENKRSMEGMEWMRARREKQLQEQKEKKAEPEEYIITIKSEVRTK